MAACWRDEELLLPVVNEVSDTVIQEREFALNSLNSCFSVFF